jgi:large subunit ribosomal protein L18
MASDTKEAKQRRHIRIRKKVSGTPLRPRLSVYRSLNHIYAQITDDMKGHTLVSSSSLEPELKGHKGHRGNVAMAKLVGGILAKKAGSKGIKKVVFDRGGYIYHGRIKALADAAREAGLEF